ncbi:MAG: MFS transporter [Phormidesmis sp.]
MTSLQSEATQPSVSMMAIAPLSSTESPLVELPLVDQPLAVGRLPKSDVRKSLRASTLDGTFSSAFENVVRGVLISNFLLGLGAGAFEVGLLASIPMLAHLLQPLGAYFSEKTTSRHLYCLWIYGTSRLLWLLPAMGIFCFSSGFLDAHGLTLLTMGVLTISNILDAIGCASWMSWMAVLVPAKLRGRYFSLRRSLSSLTALLTIPVGGWLVSSWMGGEVEGYCIVLIVAVLIGLVSLGFQFRMSDANPKMVTSQKVARSVRGSDHKLSAEGDQSPPGIWGDRNFLTLLLFLGLWTFGVNLSAPFFNFYLLDTLRLDVKWVTLYSSLNYGAFFLMIMLWGRLADRIGNRPVLMINCLLVAAIPLLWLYTDSGAVSLLLGLPLLHILQGGTFAAIDLCLGNIQLELAPVTRQSVYFAIAAAIMGVTGALGATVGSFLAELPAFGLLGVFALSALVRLASITPLVFVTEARAQSIRQLINLRGYWAPRQWRLSRVKA